MKNYNSPFIQKLLASSVVRDVSKILTGSAISQIVVLLVLPFLAKIYQPSDMALLGLALSFVNFFGVLSCLRFELAIISTKSREEALNVYYLCLLSMTITIPLFSFILLLMNKFSIFGFENFSLITGLLTILILFCSALSLATRNITIFLQKYALVGTNNVIQQGFGSIMQFLIGIFNPVFSSLLAGELLGRATSMVVLIQKISTQLKHKVTKDILKKTSRKNIKFAIYSTPSSFIENSAGNMIIPLMFYLFPAPEVGLFVLIQKISAFPISALSRMIADVFHERLSKVHTNPSLFFIKFTKHLIALSVVVCIGLCFFYFSLFDFFFESKWYGARAIGLITIPWFGAQIVVGTLSRALFVFHHQGKKLIYDCLLIGSTLVVFGISYVLKFSMIQFFILHTTIKVVLYGIYYMIIFRAVPEKAQ